MESFCRQEQLRPSEVGELDVSQGGSRERGHEMSGDGANTRPQCCSSCNIGTHGDSDIAGVRPHRDFAPRLSLGEIIKSFCVMGRVGMIARQLTLCLLFANLLPQHVAQGAWLLNAHVQGELAPCKDVPGGIPGWDCFDPPTSPLPPCDCRHQRAGFECWPRSPPVAMMLTVTEVSAAGVVLTSDASRTTTESAHHFDGMLPPCKYVRGGIPGWDCFDPPTVELPPCDFKHQKAGFDCWPKSPLSPMVTTESAHHVMDGMLPPCKDVPSGIPEWGCYDPPKSPLPPRVFKHQRIVTDCKPPTPPHL